MNDLCTGYLLTEIEENKTTKYIAYYVDADSVDSDLC